VRVLQSLQATPPNPKDLNLAQSDFRRSLTQSKQLPKTLVAQIFREYCSNQIRVDQKSRDCNALAQPILSQTGDWGPDTVPNL
jgi:hypothetical protein